MKKLYITIAALIGLAACQMAELDKFETADPQKDDQQKLMLKSLLTGRDTRWTVDDLEIPSEENGWKLISNDKELAFLLEFGSVSGEKYRLTSDIDLAGSLIEEKLAGEIGVENFENFEFDGNGKTISGLNVPLAAGLFSRVKDSKIYNFTLNSCTVGDQENVSNTLGTGMAIGSASGTVEVSDVTVSECNVCAPCKVGGLAGSVIDATCTFTSCQVKNTDVATIYRKGISGWCGGFIGFVGRSEEKSGAVTVKVETNQCVLNGGTVKAHKESDTRGVGLFLGALNGFDSKESFAMTGCTVNTTFTGLDANASKHPNYLIGAHKYMNGIILIDGSTYAFPWDGVTKTQPILSGGAYHVYTAEELAWFQGRTETTNKILIHRDIDLGGHLFTPIQQAKHVDGQKIDGKNSEIRNLKVNFKQTSDSDGYGGAFINRVKTSGTVHQNLNFRYADIYTEHYDVVPPDLTKAGQYGNGYAATLCSRVNSGMTYNVSNVHCYDGKIDGVCKIGGLLGGSWGTLTVENCSVENYYIQNYQVDCLNAYKIEKTKDVVIGTQTVTCYAEFYTEGECGGLIGFLASNSEIMNSVVKNTKMKCYGQNDQEVSIKRNGTHFTNYLIPGRHVNQFIGDIRTQSESESAKVVVKIVEPTVLGNVYVGTGYMYTPKTDDTELSADSDQAVTYDYNYTWSNYNTEYIGSAYYIGAELTVFGYSIMHEGDYQGTVTITKDGITTNVSVDGGIK